MASRPDVKTLLEQTSMSAAQYREALSQGTIPGRGTSPAGKGRKSKFNAIAVKSEDGHFDSKLEYKRYLDLKLLLRAGLIADLQRQVRYPLQAGGIHVSTYVADFVYQRDGETVVEDSKGFRTPEYRQKKRLMKEILGITILETGPTKKGRR